MEKSSKRLYRAGKDYIIGGVCAGLADYLAVDVTLLRILWLALTLFNGVGVIIYLVCMILIPKNPEHEKLPAAERTRAGNSALYIGVALVILGAMLTFDNMFDFFWWKFDWWFFNFHWHIVWPVLLILLGVWFIYQASGTPENESDDAGAHTFVRSKTQRMIGGVCGGLADYWNIDVTLVRIGYVLATLFTAIWVGVVAYVVMLFIVPEEVEKAASEAPRRQRKKTSSAKKTDQSEKGGSHE